MALAHSSCSRETDYDCVSIQVSYHCNPPCIQLTCKNRQATVVKPRDIVSLVEPICIIYQILCV